MSKQKVVNTQEVFECFEKGMNVNEISKKLKISRPTIYIKRGKWVELNSTKQSVVAIESVQPEPSIILSTQPLGLEDLVKLTEDFRAKIESVRMDYKKAVADILAKI